MCVQGRPSKSPSAHHNPFVFVLLAIMKQEWCIATCVPLTDLNPKRQYIFIHDRSQPTSPLTHLNEKERMRSFSVCVCVFLIVAPFQYNDAKSHYDCIRSLHTHTLQTHTLNNHVCKKAHIKPQTITNYFV